MMSPTLDPVHLYASRLRESLAAQVAVLVQDISRQEPRYWGVTLDSRPSFGSSPSGRSVKYAFPLPSIASPNG
jgi:vancomycin permeability regulator SanA